MTQPTFSGHSSAKDSGDERALLRRSLLLQRRSVDAGLRRQWDQSIAAQLLTWCRQNQPASLGVYWPIQNEPDLQTCYSALRVMGVALALPLVASKNAPLTFLLWQESDVMSQDEHGIPVPAQREHLLMPDALLIPCVGFNAGNFRLGYGGGYYDRTLAQQPRPVALGVAYRCALADFQVAEHDIALDKIFTEETRN